MTRPSWQDFGTHDESIVPELWDGVVGAWAPCLGPTGSRLHDMSRWSNWGTLTNMDNATDWVVSDGQYALDFDGVDDGVRVGSPQILNLTGAMSGAAWIYPYSVANVTNGRAVFSTINSGGNRLQFYVAISRDGPRITIFANGGTIGLISQTNLVANRWQHIAFTRSGISGAWVYTVFLNGKPDGVASVSANPDTPQQPFGIGRHEWLGAIPFLGMINDVVLYNRSLSENEIRQLYQLGRGGMYQRRRRRSIYLPQAGFQPAWALRRSQIIGGGLR